MNRNPNKQNLNQYNPNDYDQIIQDEVEDLNELPGQTLTTATNNYTAPLEIPKGTYGTTELTSLDKEGDPHRITKALEEVSAAILKMERHRMDIEKIVLLAGPLTMEKMLHNDWWVTAGGTIAKWKRLFSVLKTIARRHGVPIPSNTPAGYSNQQNSSRISNQQDDNEVAVRTKKQRVSTNDNDDDDIQIVGSLPPKRNMRQQQSSAAEIRKHLNTTLKNRLNPPKNQPSMDRQTNSSQNQGPLVIQTQPINIEQLLQTPQFPESLVVHTQPIEIDQTTNNSSIRESQDSLQFAQQQLEQQLTNLSDFTRQYYEQPQNSLSSYPPANQPLHGYQSYSSQHQSTQLQHHQDLYRQQAHTQSQADQDDEEFLAAILAEEPQPQPFSSNNHGPNLPYTHMGSVSNNASNNLPDILANVTSVATSATRSSNIPPQSPLYTQSVERRTNPTESLSDQLADHSSNLHSRNHGSSLLIQHLTGGNGDNNSDKHHR